MSFDYAEPMPMPADHAGPVSGGSLFDQLRRELATPLPSETLRIRVPGRQQFVLTFDTRMSYEQRQSLFERTKRADGTTDVLRAAVMMLADQSRSVELNGEVLTDDDGKDLTLRSRSLIDSTGAVDQIGALRQLFGDDADLINAGAVLSRAVGYDDPERQSAMVDPTGQ